MNAPCKDCPDRRVGCHSICEKYIAFDKSRKAMLEKRYKIKAEEYEIWRTSRYSKYRKMRK